jgi:serine/threonine-protein kinase
MIVAVVGEVIGGRYELEELVGTGGMSNVYRAHDRLLERMVAVKLLHDRYSDDDEYVERFRREARAAARLSHPNIVTVIDRGEQDGRQFIVFEHVAGENLKEVVRERGALPIKQAIELVLQVARALSFAHEHGLVHRDVKPQNVLLNGDGRAKVTDFGIARTLDVEGVTITGTVLGTSHYIAPEQARGELVDAQSDVYSLGAVLYELLTGEVPFPGDNFVAVAMQHIRDEPPSVLEKRPEVSMRLGAAVERALEKDPAKRFPSMHAFVDELEACLGALGEEGENEPTMIVRPPPAPGPRPRRAEDEADTTASRRPQEAGPRRWWPVVLVFVGLAIAIGVAGWLALRDSTGVFKKAHHGPRPVALQAVASYDPLGDGSERSDIIGFATDRDLSTAWSTETYYSRQLYTGSGAPKAGVGLVLDAGRPRKLSQLTIRTANGGYRAVIRAGNQESGSLGSFAVVSKQEVVGKKTTFELTHSRAVRYYLIWITKLAGRKAFVNEVTARSA